MDKIRIPFLEKIDYALWRNEKWKCKTAITVGE